MEKSVAKFSKSLLIILSIAILTFAACSEETDTNDQNEDRSGNEEVNDSTTDSDESTDDDEDLSEDINEDPDMETSSTGEPEYITYSEETYEELKGKEPFALFFHAEWCPVCKGIEEDLDENLAEFPEGTKILQADFDDETELKQEFGVTTQSTLVFLDADGNVTETLNGPDWEEIRDSLAANL